MPPFYHSSFLLYTALVAKGLTIAQIAAQLRISFHTANAHVRSIYKKLEITSRSAAVRYALEHHLS
jgi:DNA-binding NarL/FixJ family response regulator